MFGPQGSGKGTQAKILADRYRIPHISTGDMLRAAIAKETELGNKAKALINEGKLVPDEIVNGIVKERLAMGDCVDGYILDVYPRNLDQAKELEAFADIKYVIELHVPDDISVSRIVHRRQCKACGAIFGLDFPPKVEGVCDKCGEVLYQRDDDKEEAMKKRLAIYHEETEALIGFYSPKEIVYKVDGTMTVDEVQKALTKILG